MRPAPGKKLLVVLDHVSNSLEHGRPTTRVQWSLKGGVKRKKGEATEPSPWQCRECNCLNPFGTIECAECGLIHEVEAGEKRPETAVNSPGHLAELTPEIIEQVRRAPYREFIATPRSYAELKLYADHRDYRPGWIRHVMCEESASREEVA